MKVKLLCFLAIIANCNAGLLGAIAGASSGHVSIEVQPQHLEHVEPVHQHVEEVHAVQQLSHVAPAPVIQPQVQVIKIQNIGGGGYGGGGYGGGGYGGGGHGGGHAGDYGGGYAEVHDSGYSYGGGGYAAAGAGSHAQAQIIKIIHEQAPISSGHNAGGYAIQGYSSGHGQSYAPSYPSYHTPLESILPQILKIIYEDSGSYVEPLIDTYGNKGHVVITKGGKWKNDYFKSGRVVEKGHLEVVKVIRENRDKIGGNGGGLRALLGGLGGGK